MSFFDSKRKDKWREALHIKIMSSEKSAIEGDFEVIPVKLLPWRSDEADILKRLDNRILSDRSPQDVKQRKESKERIHLVPNQMKSFQHGFQLIDCRNNFSDQVTLIITSTNHNNKYLTQILIYCYSLIHVV